MYDSESIPKPWVSGGATWNREHVWPQSRLGTSASPSRRNIASDPHNLRAIIPKTNSNRGNRYFVNGTGLTGDIVGANGYYPGDAHRGDVARILLYMAVRYKDVLSLTQNPSGTEMGDIRVLYNWHLEDPVDDFEIQRNDVIYEHQGNRNPFIDHPELFKHVWEYFMEKVGLTSRQMEVFNHTINTYLINQVTYVKLKRSYTH